MFEDDDTVVIGNANGGVSRVQSVQHAYCPVAVDKAIASSTRSGRRIGKREARLIHALLKGRGQ